MAIRSVGICLKRDQPQAGATVRELVKWLVDRGCEAQLDEHAALCADAEPANLLDLCGAVDLIVVLGGDGTLLSVARAVGTRRVPILGVNLGTLGFLTEVNVDELFPALEHVLADRAEVEVRMRLEIVVVRGEEEVGRYQALNDAVITRIALSRMIDLEARADGVAVTTYHGDGLIASTPTGSTAYSLSAGGPLVLPGTGVILLTPICPHSLTHRPLVIAPSSQIEVRVSTRGGEASLTVDGQEGLALQDGDCVRICHSEYPVEIIASPFRTRYEIMREKLRWGER